MAINTVLKAGDTLKISKSFGIVGAAVIRSSNVPVAVVVANDNKPLQDRDIIVNKPLVKMISALASIDGFMKQKLENQKIISKSAQLAGREARIEQTDQTPQIEVIKPDAEKVGGSSAGLFALGGLALLTLDPVQEALKDIVDGVTSMGKFVSGVIKSLNDTFKFFVGENKQAPEADLQPQTNDKGIQPAAASEAPQDVNATPIAQQPAAVQPAAEKKPSFLASVGSAALTGGAIGSFVPGVGAVTGAVVGGAIGAAQYFSQSGGTQQEATPVSAPPVSPGGSQPAQPTQATPQQGPATAPGEIPKNDIVALGNYLIGKGAERHKMQHHAFGPVGEHSKNSRHYRGMAIDVNFPGPNEGAILDALEPQLRAAGYNTIWRKKGHHTHMHVSVGGPEGAGGGSYGDSNMVMNTIGSAVSDAAAMSLEQLGKIFGIIGSAVIKPGVPKDDIANTIGVAARELNTDIAVTKTQKPVSLPTPPLPPNINKMGNGAVENQASQTDKNSVYYYLRRFGYQDLNVPSSTLVKATVA